MARSVRVRIPATTANLGPGFDALGLALELHNELTVACVTNRPGSLGWEEAPEVTVEGEGRGSLPTNRENLTYRAVCAAYAAMGRTVPPLRLVASNQIPLARGLGSSAAAIVGGLMAANALEDYPFDEARLLALANELEGHPDNVAAALLGGLVVCVRVDGHVLARRIPLADGLVAVLCVPDRPLSTAAARRVVPEQVSRDDAIFNLGRAALLVHCLTAGDWRPLAIAMEDHLHQPARATIFPPLRPVIAAALAAGAAGAALSGAGSTILALVEQASGRADSVALAMVEAAAAAAAPARAVVTGLSQQGAMVAADKA